MESLGVKVFYGKEMGVDGLTLESLKAKGYGAIFLGTGCQVPKKNLGDIYKAKNVFNSKTYLPDIMMESKPGMVENPPKI